jgi:5-methylcytosine-specific restriction protein A
MPAKIPNNRRPWELKIESGKQQGRKEKTGFYSSAAWVKLRNWYRNAHPLCEECDKKGRIRQMKIVDHIQAIRDGGGALDAANLQSLCDSCHNSKSGKERHK